MMVISTKFYKSYKFTEKTLVNLMIILLYLYPNQIIKKMKTIKLLSFLFLSILITSCSSEDDSGDSTPSSSFIVNGSNITLTSATALRVENTLQIVASASDGSSMDLTFDKFGNLGEVRYFDAEFNSNENFQHFKANYFTFNLISINETQKKVEVSFSGNLYEEEDDLNSASIVVSGSFNLPYTEQTPTISGLGLSCKIAGTDWYDVEFWDNGFWSVDRKFISDDEYMIIMKFTDEAIQPGSYNFTTSSENGIQLAKYDTETNTYIEYNAVGTLTISSNSEFSPLISVVDGTFSFTATNPSNPSDQIQVTNGTFKTNF